MRFKTKITLFFSSKKVNVFVLFLVLALLFSVLTKLSKDYTQTVVFNIEKVNIPVDKLIVNDSSHLLNITLTTYGFKLIKYYLARPSIVVDFQKLEKNKTHYFWTEKKEFSTIVSQFEPNVKIVSINPDTIAFRYDVNNVKKIPVILDADITFSVGFDVINDYVIKPDSIKVIGPKVLTDSISEIFTKRLKMEDVNADVLISVELNLTNSSEGLKFTHSQVQISAVVERFTEGTINVPINIINIPEGIKLKYYPKEVSVVYYTSLSNFKTISTSSFIVEVDYNSLNAQDTYLIPKIVQQPDKVKNVRLNEKRIEFILLQ
ncbi:YbbR-like domain-containing protein [Flavobacteriaceae bacterium PRS1]|nr:YbbR-like domain-containing protein [Flavobacteriaceae bacterium PRS1]